MADLPDYTKYVALNVDIPESDVGPANVGIYESAPADLPDGTRAPLLTDIKGRLIVVQYEKDRTVETLAGKFVRIKGFASDEVPITISGQDIIPRPKGGFRASGEITSGAAYATVATRTVTSGKKFQVSKILVSVEKAAWIIHRWNASQVGCARLLDDKTTLIEHFPYDNFNLLGDGAKAFDVQAKQYSEAGLVDVEVVGEEV